MIANVLTRPTQPDNYGTAVVLIQIVIERLAETASANLKPPSVISRLIELKECLQQGGPSPQVIKIHELFRGILIEAAPKKNAIASTELKGLKMIEILLLEGNPDYYNEIIEAQPQGTIDSFEVSALGSIAYNTVDFGFLLSGKVTDDIPRLKCLLERGWTQAQLLALQTVREHNLYKAEEIQATLLKVATKSSNQHVRRAANQLLEPVQIQ